MPIKTTFGQIAILRQTPNRPTALSRLANKEISSPSSSLHVYRLVKALNKEIEAYDAALVEILRKYGKQRENSNPIVFDIASEKLAEYNEEVMRLNGSETEIPMLPVPWKFLEGLGLSAQDLIDLEPFIKFPEE